SPAAAPVNIGFCHRPEPNRRQFVEAVRRNQADRALEQAARERCLYVPLDQVEAEWRHALGPEHARNVAEHYGVFGDLFGVGFFTPVLPLRVSFPLGEEECAVAHVGNSIKPAEASRQPDVAFEAPEHSLWTLVCTNLEGPLGGEAPELVHWLVQNIPGSDVSRGDVVYEYLQPLPFRGTGHHRIVFVLYKQQGVLPRESESAGTGGGVLDGRKFSTEQFYRRHEDQLTPAGLAFFQSDWDYSVTEFFHNVLQRKEPVFEFDFKPPYIRRQRWFPKGESVVHYFDKYADPKDLHKQMLLKRLAKVSPFEGVAEEPKYPLAIPKEVRGPRPATWIINERRKEARKISKYYYIDRRPDTVFDPHV
ncbi:39S ribosomal protein L38, mitochondrial-like, partial [Pollicipes pollicipes]|uniref:39S ribosomal protein L38, mitochondrial-like n=1 Tax=Pollicipes pollicipes TaxID=41117 RepID=UPI0018854548